MRKPFRVVYVPFDHINPYQKLLTQELRGLGLDVTEITLPRLALFFEFLQTKPDILHLHWLHPFFLARGKFRSWRRGVVFLILLWLFRIVGIKIVWTAHNLNNHEKRLFWLDRAFTFAVTRLSHAIIAHCEAAKKEIARVFRIERRENIFVVPQGHYQNFYKNQVTRNEARKALDLPDSMFVFLFFGNIREYKGVFELAEEFLRFNHEESILMIAGPVSPVLRSHLLGYEKKSGRLKILPRFIEEDEIQILMNVSDIVVFPYREILTSAAVMLAMSFGKPCIAVRKGCLGETLDEKGSFLYDPTEADGLLRSIREAVEKRDSLGAMGEYNRRRAQPWSWADAAKATQKIYQQCAT